MSSAAHDMTIMQEATPYVPVGLLCLLFLWHLNKEVAIVIETVTILLNYLSLVIEFLQLASADRGECISEQSR